MDKFANEDNDHIDAEEYVAVQAGIDDVKGFDVFVFATVQKIGLKVLIRELNKIMQQIHHRNYRE